MNDEEMKKEIIKAAKAFSKPINFEKLISDGFLIKKGKSYYTTNIKDLPEDIGKRIKEAVPTKNGLRVTFYKESKSLKKVADKFG